jgi:hypothetical protein
MSFARQTFSNNALPDRLETRTSEQTTLGTVLLGSPFCLPILHRGRFQPLFSGCHLTTLAPPRANRPRQIHEYHRAGDKSRMPVTESPRRLEFFRLASSVPLKSTRSWMPYQNPQPSVLLSYFSFLLVRFDLWSNTKCPLATSLFVIVDGMLSGSKSYRSGDLPFSIDETQGRR